MEFKNILIPTDLSQAATYAAQAGIKLARLTGGRVTLLHCFDLPPFIDPSLITIKKGEPVKLRDRLEAEARSELEKAVGELRVPDVPMEGMVVEGRPDQVIVDMAPRFDLVVMGTHGRTGLSHLLIGSVAELVVRRSPIPVLCIRHPAE